MKREALTLVAGAFFLLGPSVAQFDTGGVPQEVQRSMEQAMRDLESQSLGITTESMAEHVGQEQLQSFLQGAVVRLVLSPQGSFTAYSLEGGELVAFRLGKERVDARGDYELLDNWVRTRGDFSIPKRPQKLSMTLSAGDRQVTVDCYNKYGSSDEEVTFYVGPLNGLFCMGLTDEEPG